MQIWEPDVAITSKDDFNMLLKSSFGPKPVPNVDNSQPKVKLNLRYKNWTRPNFLIHHVPKVYKDSIDFDWSERDYILTNTDHRFLWRLKNKNSDDEELQAFSEDNLEEFIDLMEKIGHKSKNMDE